jgi:iron complex transport system ATP-binding protein
MRLSATDLCVGYGRRRVAAGVSIELNTGDVFCLLGPNGCGKTTVFRTLLGLIPPLSGTVRLDSRRLEQLSRREVARRIAYVPQAHTPAFPYTVEEVVLMGRAAHLGVFSRPGRADRRLAESALAQLGIGSLAGADYSLLSGGQRQLVLIARALAGEAAFMIMDEPAASLDYGNQSLVLDRIRSLAAGGVGILLSSHDPGQVLAVGDRAALMRDGAVLRQGPVDEVMDAATLSAVYGMAVDVIVLPDGRKVCLPGLAQDPGAARTACTNMTGIQPEEDARAARTKPEQ